MTKKSPKFLAFMERKLAPLTVILKLQQVQIRPIYKGKNFVRYFFSGNNGNTIGAIDFTKEEDGTIFVYSYHCRSGERVPVKDLNEFVLNDLNSILQ